MPSTAVKNAIKTLQSSITQDQVILDFLTTVIRMKTDAEVREAVTTHKALVSYCSDPKLPNDVREAWHALSNIPLISLDDDEASLQQTIQPLPEIKESKNEIKLNPADIASTITPQQLEEAKERLKKISLTDEKAVKEVLTQAAMSGDLAMIKLLYSQGHHGNNYPKNDRPLYKALACNQLKAALLMLQLNPEVNPNELNILTLRYFYKNDLYLQVVKELEKAWLSKGSPLWKLFPSLWHQRAFHGGPYLEAMTPEDLLLESLSAVPLHYACANPDEKQAISAVKQICDLYKQFQLEIPNVLQDTIRQNKILLAKQLIEIYNLNPFIKSNIGSTLLHFANSNEMLDYLLNLIKIDLHDKNNNGRNALRLFINIGDQSHLYLYPFLIKKTEILITKGLDINDRDNDGKTFLCDLISLRKMDYSSEEWEIRNNLVRWLVEHGADINLGNQNGRTPLHYAAVNNNWDDIVYLLMHGADPNKLNDKNFGTLSFAVQLNHYEIANLLLRVGVDIHQKDKNGKSPLFSTSNPDMHRLLLEQGADIRKEAKSYLPNTTAHALTLNQLKLIFTHLFNTQRFSVDKEFSSAHLGRTETLKHIIYMMLQHFKYNIILDNLILNHEYLWIKKNDYGSIGSLSEALGKHINPEYGDYYSTNCRYFDDLNNLFNLIAGLRNDMAGNKQRAADNYRQALTQATEKEYILTTLGEINLIHAERLGFPCDRESKSSKQPDYASAIEHLTRAVNYFLQAKQFQQVLDIALKLEKMDLFAKDRDEFSQLQNRDVQKLKPLGFFEKRRMNELSEKLKQDDSIQHINLLLSLIINSISKLDCLPEQHWHIARLVRDHYPSVPFKMHEAFSIANMHINNAFSKQIKKLENDWVAEERLETAVKAIAEARLKKFPEQKEDIESAEFKLEKMRLQTAEQNLKQAQQNLFLIRSGKLNELTNPLLKEIIDFRSHLEKVYDNEASRDLSSQQSLLFVNQRQVADAKNDKPAVAARKALQP